MSGPYGHTENSLPDTGVLTGPARDPEDVRAAALAALGQPAPPRPRRGGLPDVTGLREAMGEEFWP